MSKKKLQDILDLSELLESNDDSQECQYIRKEDKGTTYNIKIYDDFRSPDTYYELINTIQTSSEKDTIIFDIASGGGDYSGFLVMFGALMKCKANTVAVVHEACSAASMLALSCDKVVMSPFGYFMIHSFSGGSYGKKQELKAKAKFDEDYFNEVMRVVYLPFLTEEELKNVDSGDDMWITAPDARERLKNWTPIKKRLKELIK